MLELVDIKKDYPVAGGVVNALKGVSIKFRKNEFVSILGASGCGKTTLLNIIGGLDKYTSGDLIIEGKSTKQYKDGDWDTYRNHSIGFIFQSYHLIPHQTVLQNVELALLISGVSKEERRKRAIAALERVGLGDKLKNRPNQLSGGQAQRVAIARALINDPEIVLADEPTGALDSKTSVQIMELLKEVSNDRLVIMVTHNPELAEQYSTRIIRLLDGEVVDDTMPYNGVEETVPQQTQTAEQTSPADGAATSPVTSNAPSVNAPVSSVIPAEAEESSPDSAGQPKTSGQPKTNKGRKKKASMSVGMAFSLSLKNLLSKIKRTTLVSVAGSIGIIGVSMVLAISSGVQMYIADMENDMLSGYPLTVTETAIDFNALMDIASSNGVKVDATKLNDKVYVDSLLETLMSFDGAQSTNNITMDYKRYVDAMPETYYNALQYGYGFDMSNYVYTDFSVGETDGSPVTVQNVSITGIRAKYTSILKMQEKYKNYASMISTIDSLEEIPNNYEYILSQYDILATDLGKTEKLTEAELKSIFEDKESLIMVVGKGGFSDLNFGQYGYMTETEFLQFAYKAEGNSEYDKAVIEEYEKGVSFDKFVGGDAKFRWYPNSEIFSPATAEDIFHLDGYPPIAGGTAYAPYKYNSTSDGFKEDEAFDLKVRVILQKKDGISYGCLSSGIYYTEALTKHTLKTSLESGIVKDVRDNYGGSLQMVPYNYDYVYIDDNGAYRTADATYMLLNLGGGGMAGMMMPGGGGGNDITKIGLSQLAGNEVPAAFYIYPLDFDTKKTVTDYLDKWNDACKSGEALEFTGADGIEYSFNLSENGQIKYTDTVGIIINMVNTMIEMITIALVAFTALSLVVSTVMIGIITYVSVVERVKEIGILRAVGARKRDIKRLFNAETFIIGLAAGLVGIIVTYLLSLILNLVLGVLFGIFTIASLPIWQALIMVVVSVVLTLISGLIPAAAAAKKDPVVALRTE